jgi:hypothetical protein
MDTNKLLPVGTVVLLKNANTELMILGYKPKIETDQGDKNPDYVACQLRGIKGLKSYRFFNKEDIDKVVFLGYADNDFFNLAMMLEKK